MKKLRDAVSAEGHATHTLGCLSLFNGPQKDEWVNAKTLTEEICLNRCVCVFSEICKLKPRPYEWLRNPTLWKDDLIEGGFMLHTLRSVIAWVLFYNHLIPFIIVGDFTMKHWCLPLCGACSWTRWQYFFGFQPPWWWNLLFQILFKSENYFSLKSILALFETTQKDFIKRVFAAFRTMSPKHS